MGGGCANVHHLLDTSTLIVPSRSAGFGLTVALSIWLCAQKKKILEPATDLSITMLVGGAGSFAMKNENLD